MKKINLYYCSMRHIKWNTRHRHRKISFWEMFPKLPNHHRSSVSSLPIKPRRLKDSANHNFPTVAKGYVLRVSGWVGEKFEEIRLPNLIFTKRFFRFPLLLPQKKTTRKLTRRNNFFFLSHKSFSSLVFFLVRLPKSLFGGWRENLQPPN